MILPTKHLREERSLLGVGAHILEILDEPKTVSRVWEELLSGRSANHESLIPFDWFVLTLDLLFTIGAVKRRRGLLEKAASR